MRTHLLRRHAAQGALLQGPCGHLHRKRAWQFWYAPGAASPRGHPVQYSAALHGTHLVGAKGGTAHAGQGLHGARALLTTGKPGQWGRVNPVLTSARLPQVHQQHTKAFTEGTEGKPRTRSGVGSSRWQGWSARGHFLSSARGTRAIGSDIFWPGTAFRLATDSSERWRTDERSACLSRETKPSELVHFVLS